MLEYRTRYMCPFYNDKLRLFMMKNYNYDDDLSGDGYLKRLDDFAEALVDNDIWLFYNRYRQREFPFVGKERMNDEYIMRDLMIKDSFTQNKYINELFRKGQVSTGDMMLIYHPNTKFMSSMSRGIERDLLFGYLNLDDEYVNRKQLRPSTNI